MEYSRTGVVIKGQEKAIAKSRYEEDVYFNNHTVRIIAAVFSFSTYTYTYKYIIYTYTYKYICRLIASYFRMWDC